MWVEGVLDGNAEFVGGGRQTLIERDEGRIEASGNREMEGIRRSEPQIKAPGIYIGEPGIGGRNVDRQAHRRTPSIEVGQTRLTIGAATVVNGFVVGSAIKVGSRMLASR